MLYQVSAESVVAPEFTRSDPLTFQRIWPACRYNLRATSVAPAALVSIRVAVPLKAAAVGLTYSSTVRAPAAKAISDWFKVFLI